jgi:enoyl-CoA hydratase/carnithine racemase
MARTKQAIWQAQELSLEAALRNAWQLITRHNAGPDFAEGVRAFRERRPPRWRQFSEE